MMPAAQRAAYATVLESIPANLALSLAWNDWPIAADRIKRDLRALHSRIDRALLGRRFHKFPPDQRTQFWSITERMDCHPHVHSAWRCSRPAVLADMLAGGVWQEIAPAGTFDLQVYSAGWATYACKALTDGCDAIYTSAEVIPI